MKLPVTCTRQVVDYKTECRVGTKVEMVETTKCVPVCTGEWKGHRILPRARSFTVAVFWGTAARLSSLFVSSDAWVCKKVWCPKVDYQTVKCCTPVCKPYTYTVQVPCCRTECYTVYKDHCYTTCRIEKEQCVKYVTKTRCYTIPEEHVKCVPYTTPHGKGNLHQVRGAASAATPFASRRFATKRTRPAESKRKCATSARPASGLLHDLRREGMPHPVHDMPHIEGIATIAAKRSDAARRCEKHVKYVPYTTCRIEKMAHQVCDQEALLHDQRDLLEVRTVYSVPHGAADVH